MRSIEIAGGGLAGLAAGIALRRRGVPVVVHEAGKLPRHRVCGEFIAGLDTATIKALGIESLLADAPRHDTMLWHQGDRELGTSRLPSPAIGISRHALDARLADEFRRLGGELRLGDRAKFSPGAEGWVDATGRRASNGGWAGMKIHLEGFVTKEPLEFHLGRGAYVGLSSVESGAVNICGLFRTPLGGTGAGFERMVTQLDACGLGSLAARARMAAPVPGSFCAVAGLAFAPWPRAHREPSIGDAAGMIPPFTGDGMSIALQGAVAAAAPLSDYSGGTIEWQEAVARIRRTTRRKFRFRLGAAALLHPLLTWSAGQASLAVLHRARLIPFTTVFNVLH